jgi:hypothetical protein
VQVEHQQVRGVLRAQPDDPGGLRRAGNVGEPVVLEHPLQQIDVCLLIVDDQDAGVF